MINISNDLEDRIEELYWEFDTERKRTGMERDAFKFKLRKLIRELLEVKNNEIT